MPYSSPVSSPSVLLAAAITLSTSGLLGQNPAGLPPAFDGSGVRQIPVTEVAATAQARAAAGNHVAIARREANATVRRQVNRGSATYLLTAENTGSGWSAEIRTEFAGAPGNTQSRTVTLPRRPEDMSGGDVDGDGTFDLVTLYPDAGTGWGTILIDLDAMGASPVRDSVGPPFSGTAPMGRGAGIEVVDLGPGFIGAAIVAHDPGYTGLFFEEGVIYTFQYDPGSPIRANILWGFRGNDLRLNYGSGCGVKDFDALSPAKVVIGQAGGGSVAEGAAFVSMASDGATLGFVPGRPGHRLFDQAIAAGPGHFVISTHTADNFAANEVATGVVQVIDHLNGTATFRHGGPGMEYGRGLQALPQGFGRPREIYIASIDGVDRTDVSLIGQRMWTTAPGEELAREDGLRLRSFATVDRATGLDVPLLDVQGVAFATGSSQPFEATIAIDPTLSTNVLAVDTQSAGAITVTLDQPAKPNGDALLAVALDVAWGTYTIPPLIGVSPVPPLPTFQTLRFLPLDGNGQATTTISTPAGISPGDVTLVCVLGNAGGTEVEASNPVGIEFR